MAAQRGQGCGVSVAELRGSSRVDNGRVRFQKRRGRRIEMDFVAKVNKIVRDRKSPSQLRHLESGIERLDMSTQAAGNMMKGREITCVLAVHATTRQDHGQACARGPYGD
eukprot:9407124-Pyramimonas_sp.AAC.1